MPSPLQRVPLRQIADQAHVSRMTVSLALRDHPSLPAATRSRIRSIANRLGYQPDPEIVHLMRKIGERRRRQQCSTIAYLTANDRRSDWKRLLTPRRFHEGALRQARDNGYALEEFWMREPGMTEARMSEILRNRGIEGVLIAPVPSGQRRLFSGFRWNYFSAVAVGYSLARPALHRACPHQYQSMLLLVAELAEQGYRRFGLAMVASQDERVNYNWRGAFFAGTSLWPQTAAIPMLLTPAWSFETFAQWYQRYSPDVVLAQHPEVAEWLRRLGRRVPEDVGVAYVNVDFPDGETQTGVNQNSDMVGATAVDLLITLMRRNQRGIPAVASCLMTEATFQPGASTRRQTPRGRPAPAFT